MRVKWEIALPGSSGCYLDVRSLFGTQTVTERVEDLSLGEAARSSRHIGCQIFSTSYKWPNPELLRDGIPHSIEPAGCRGVGAATMAVTTSVAHHEVPPQLDLVLLGLIGARACARESGHRRDEHQSQKKRHQKPRSLSRSSRHVLLLVELFKA